MKGLIIMFIAFVAFTFLFLFLAKKFPYTPKPQTVTIDLSQMKVEVIDSQNENLTHIITIQEYINMLPYKYQRESGVVPNIVEAKLKYTPPVETKTEAKLEWPYPMRCPPGGMMPQDCEYIGNSVE